MNPIFTINTSRVSSFSTEPDHFGAVTSKSTDSTKCEFKGKFFSDKTAQTNKSNQVTGGITGNRTWTQWRADLSSARGFDKVRVFFGYVPSSGEDGANSSKNTSKAGTMSDFLNEYWTKQGGFQSKPASSEGDVSYTASSVGENVSGNNEELTKNDSSQSSTINQNPLDANVGLVENQEQMQNNPPKKTDGEMVSGSNPMRNREITSRKGEEAVSSQPEENLQKLILRGLGSVRTGLLENKIRSLTNSNPKTNDIPNNASTPKSASVVALPEGVNKAEDQLEGDLVDKLNQLFKKFNIQSLTETTVSGLNKLVKEKIKNSKQVAAEGDKLTNSTNNNDLGDEVMNQLSKLTQEYHYEMINVKDGNQFSFQKKTGI